MDQRQILHIDMLEALRHQRADLIRTASAGVLEIIPDFRRRGHAFYLQSHLTNVAISQNRIPYTQIKEGNEASLFLQKKCRYQYDLQRISWMFKG